MFELKSILQKLVPESQTTKIPIYILNDEVLKKLEKKFSDHTPQQIAVAIIETLKYLFLSAHTDKSIFFPGNRLIDEVWHSFITETKFYQNLCTSLGAPGIIHHTGILYTDYQKTMSKEELHEEQLSWLASYVHNFGNIDQEAYEQLMLAQALAKRFETDLQGLNQIAQTLIQSTKTTATNETWDELLPQLASSYYNLDKNPKFLSATIQKLFDIHTAEKNNFNLLFNNEKLRDLFYISPCLGFTVWQNLAAVERLSESQNWINNNPQLWTDLKTGTQKVGLGITHIVKKESILNASLDNLTYSLNGTIPWISGINIFEHFVIGFKYENKNIVALVDSDSLIKSQNATLTRLELEAFNASNTYCINLNNFKVTKNQVVSITDISEPTRKGKTQYLFPETGIARRALNEVQEKLNNGQIHNKENATESLEFLKKNILKLEVNIKTVNQNSEFILQQQKRDNIIRESIRLLVLTCKGASLKHQSLASILTLQSILLDVFIQPEELIQLKIKEVRKL